MKVCILSMQHVQNFGSLLQSYSLKKCIEKLGHKVSFIDICENDFDNGLIEKDRILYRDEIEGKGLLKKMSKIDRYAINRLIIKNKSKRQDKLLDSFRKNVLKISTADNTEHYDLCVIGSDEVFNCMAETPWGFTSQLFGNVKQADKVITYAASCGSTSYASLPEKVKEKITETFQTIAAISVRDKNTAEFVEKLSDQQIHQHLDPVLVGDFTKEMAQNQTLPILPQRFCIIYSYYNRIHKKEEIIAIESFCKKERLEIVTVGAPQMWVKNHLVLTPFQMLNVFQKANFVITDTFHGTIFAAKYSEKFAVIIRGSNYNKLYDLIRRLDIKEHVVDDMTQLQKAFTVNKNFIKLERLLHREIKNTENYFKKNIGYGNLHE